MKYVKYWIVFKDELFNKGNLKNHVHKISMDLQEVNDLVATGAYFSVARIYKVKLNDEFKSQY